MSKEVTVFVPAYEGLVDTDCGPHVYSGRLTYEQVKIIADELGGINADGYARTAINAGDDGFYVTYNADATIEPEKCENGEIYNESHEGTGNLAYYVEFREINNPPIG